MPTTTMPMRIRTTSNKKLDQHAWARSPLLWPFKRLLDGGEEVDKSGHVDESLGK